MLALSAVQSKESDKPNLCIVPDDSEIKVWPTMVDFSAPGRNSSVAARKRGKRSFESPEKQSPPPVRHSVFPTPRNVAVRPDGDQDAILSQIQ